eukprot:TRINITY_DN16373_c1_g4_i1.p1 TRINITY_DN16373_c1_g4~~TRINITY_DN16373_c1_g4_i1.p1  ORF type:complete len:734 (-),score=88.04 TRINITY_DN16373_c1_g4_i1:97-2298(-)
MAAMSEHRALLSTDAVKIIGTEFANNDFAKDGSQWHFVMVFKIPTESTIAEFEGSMPSPVSTWRNIFKGVCGTGKQPASVRDDMSRKEFYHFVFAEIVSILGGHLNGFDLDVRKSIDGDEVLLMIALINPIAKEFLALQEDFKCKLSHSVYKQKNIEVPTDVRVYNGDKGTFHQVVDVEPDGEEVRNLFSAHLNFSVKLKNKLDPLSNLECIRIIRRRISRFVSVDSLLGSGMCSQVFPAHHWEHGLQALYKKGWNDPKRLCSWPGEQRCENVNTYFGPEIGFFVHWQNFLTRYLAFPACLSLFAFVMRATILNTVVGWNHLSMIFAVILMLWSSVFTSRYEQAKNLKKLKWGMESLGPSALLPRKEFSDSYRDSCKDHLQHVFHWSMVFFFICETLVVVTFCTRLQMDAMKNPQGTTFGISNEIFAAYSNYVIIGNIKLIDKLWTPVSNVLTRRENWRTLHDLQQNMVIKMFVVKMFVFYFPFIYEITIKPMTEGCGAKHSHTHLEGCVNSLNTNLSVFFVTQIVTEIALIVLGLLLTAWKVRMEKMKFPEKQYTYLELQAKCTPYGDDELISDFLNAVVAFGYVVLFGVTLPVICCLAFLNSMVMKRLLAYKMCFAYQRPLPKAVDGIGVWEIIVRGLSYLAVPVNAYVAFFTLASFQDRELWWKLLMFILTQNFGTLLKMTIEGFISSKATAHLRIEEHHTENMDHLLDEDDPEHITDFTPNVVKCPYAL